MNDTITKKPFPFKTVVITALITVFLTALFFHFSGIIGTKSNSQKNDSAISGHTDAEHETLYTCGMHPWITEKEPGNCPICGMKLTPKRGDNTSNQTSGERVIAYWRAPMNPTEIYDKPGKSAMGMDLVPVYEDEVIGGVEIKIDPVTQQNMGLRTAKVKKGALNHTIRTYGHVTYDETKTFQVNLKFSGWIEKLHVDFMGQMVKKGDPLFEIYSPELISVQDEYLEAYRNSNRNPGRAGKTILDSAHRKLKFFDIADSEIRAIEKSGKIKDILTIRSPFEGVVTHKNAVEGGFVKAGMDVYKISDLSRVWVEAHIYEYELGLVTPGLEATMTLPYRLGKKYAGKVTFIYPYLQQKTRDVVIRVEFENPNLELKPDMYADVYIQTSEKDDGLIIPSEAVIRSGSRNIVFVNREKGKFTPREVTLGITVDNGMIQILKGLAPGEIIVTSGQFLLDSESKLKEAVQKMLEAKNAEPEPDKNEQTGQAEDDFFDDI